MPLDMVQLCYGQRHVQVTILIDKMRSGMLTTSDFCSFTCRFMLIKSPSRGSGSEKVVKRSSHGKDVESLKSP